MAENICVYIKQFIFTTMIAHAIFIFYALNRDNDWQYLMKFLNLLDEKFVFAKQDVASYKDALSFIASKLAEERGIQCGKEKIFEALLEREALGGTVLPNGLAIPHVRIECLDDFWIAVLTPKVLLKYKEIKVNLIVLFLIPQAGSDVYLQTLSGLAKYTADKNFIPSVEKAKDRQALLSLFNDFEVKKDFLVRDIMTQEMFTVSPETKIREVADILYSKNLSYIPVLSTQGAFIGEVTLLDIIREGIPDYAIRIGDLSFLKSFEPFEELIRKEDTLMVREIMADPEVKLHPDDSIAEAGLNFIRHSRRQIPVVEGNRIVGILSIIDLLKKVIRV